MEGNQSKGRARGFAAMDQDRQKEIARKGGKAAHERGTAHEFTSDEARAAGRKGGERVSVDRAHMAYIGRLGGKSSAGRRAQDRTSPEGNSPDSADNSAQKGE
jgi:general stress protein YciG